MGPGGGRGGRRRRAAPTSSSPHALAKVGLGLGRRQGQRVGDVQSNVAHWRRWGGGRRRMAARSCAPATQLPAARTGVVHFGSLHRGWAPPRAARGPEE